MIPAQLLSASRSSLTAHILQTLLAPCSTHETTRRRHRDRCRHLAQLQGRRPLAADSRAARAASTRCKAFDTTEHKVKFGGDIYDWTTEGYIDRKEEKRIDRFTQFALVAGIDAVNDSGLDFSKEDPFRCGVILGSGIGGLNEIETQHERLLTKGPDKVSAFTIPKLMVNAASGHVSIRYGLRGPNYAVATACASATNAMGDAFKAIQYDDADVMVTGGTEAACTPMGLAGFANMRALSERNDDPAGASRPFDARPRRLRALRRRRPAWSSKNSNTPRSAARGSTPKCSATAPVPTAATSRSPTPKAPAPPGR